MIIKARLIASSALLGALLFSVRAAPPLQLHPENPHYLLFRQKPIVLITSGEHYGAVLNADFDFRKYLETLQKDGMNLTRTFSGGPYIEPAGAFNIASNTLAPAPGRFLCAFARSDQPGYAGGGMKFDLSRWDETYFGRFRQFMEEASRRGIIVEVNLFCPMYEERQWALSPFHASNNINSLGRIGRNDPFTLDRHGGLLAIQESMIRKFVEELRDFDNLYYEIINEPYATGVSEEWQRHMTDVLTSAQRNHPNPKLISWNISNNSKKVENPHPAVSILNFHYATPPNTVGLNWQLNRVIGDNETGFRGTNDAPYRMEAWDFILAGGGLFNHLDYSFTVGHEDGRFVYPATQPGGGNPILRKQFSILAQFINGFEFWRMKPDVSWIRGGFPASHTAQGLAEPGRAYAVYFRPWLITQYSVRWKSQLTAPSTGEFVFSTMSNDGVRLWVGEKLLIDNWTDHTETENTGRMQLEAGKSYSVRVEYFYNGGQGVMKLSWTPPGGTKAIIPSQSFRSSDGAHAGLRAEYFQGNDLQTPWRERVDPQINFQWGTTSPFPVPPTAGPVSLALSLPAGAWKAEWISPVTGAIIKSDNAQVSEKSDYTLPSPPFTEDIALRITRR